MTRKALIAGATGLVGHELLNCLLADDFYSEVTVIARRPAHLHHDKLNWIVLEDFSELLTLQNNIKADHIFCSLGTTMAQVKSKELFKKVDFEYPLLLAKLGKLLQAQTYVLVSSLGANARSKIFYNRVKGEIELAVQEQDYDCTGIFRPSVLKGSRKKPRFGENITYKLAPIVNNLSFGLLKAYMPVEAKTVALAMCDFAKQNSKHVTIIESKDIQTYNLNIKK